MSPTAQSLAYLRAGGWIAAIVERWIERRGIRVDVWHFADLLAAHPRDRQIALVQTTTASNLSARVTKAKRQPELRVWLAAGGRFFLHGWAPWGGRWHPKVIELAGADLAPVVVEQPPRKRPRSRWQPADLFGTEG